MRWELWVLISEFHPQLAFYTRAPQGSNGPTALTNTGIAFNPLKPGTLGRPEVSGKPISLLDPSPPAKEQGLLGLY